MGALKNVFVAAMKYYWCSLLDEESKEAWM
jgi:hypothetical protein